MISLNFNDTTPLAVVTRMHSISGRSLFLTSMNGEFKRLLLQEMVFLNLLGLHRESPRHKEQATINATKQVQALAGLNCTLQKQSLLQHVQVT